MSVSLEIRTTISPGPAFFRRIHYMAASLERLGGRLKNYEIVVSVGGDERRTNLYRTQPWSREYPIVWRWVPPRAWATDGYRATNRDRARHMSRADFVMLADSDVIFMEDFSDLFDRIENVPAIYGVMAHFPPFPKTTAPKDFWKPLFDAFGVEHPAHDCELTGWRKNGVESCRYSPAYFNGGMVIGPVDFMDGLFSYFPSADRTVAKLGDFYHIAQISRTLAMYKAGVPFGVLPMRYNFPNDPFFEQEYPGELSQLRILHYLRREIVDRASDFENPEAVRALIARRDLEAANEKLRRLVVELEPVVCSAEAVSLKKNPGIGSLADPGRRLAGTRRGSLRHVWSSLRRKRRR